MHSEAHSPRCRQARSTSFWLGCESSQPARVLGPPPLSGIFAAMGGSKSTGASAPVPAAGSKPNNLDKFDGLGPNYVGQAGSNFGPRRRRTVWIDRDSWRRRLGIRERRKQRKADVPDIFAGCHGHHQPQTKVRI